MSKFVDSINAKYGKRTISLLSADIESIPVIPTGSFKLDLALGVGGLPRGRITEIYGPESSGKTTLVQHLIKNCQQLGGKAALVDVEHALDVQWAADCGVKVDELYISQPDHAEMALDIVEMIIKSGEVDFIALDSVASLAPRAEVEGEMGDAHMALVARLMSQAMRKLTSIIKASNCCVVFTNQLRANIGGGMWSPDEVTTGGNALKYYASVRIDLRRSSQIKGKINGIDEVIANKVRASIRKNKVAPPYKSTEFEIYYGEGISFLSEMIFYGIEYGLIEKRGAGWHIIKNGEKEVKVQGDVQLRNLLSENKDLVTNIENIVRQTHGLPLKEE